MTCDLVALCVDAHDPPHVARFWAGLLGWRTIQDHGPTLVPDDDTGIRIRFVGSGVAKVGPNQMHLDLTSTSPVDQQRTVARSLALGARHADVGQRGDEGHVVLADPEGNEYCVIEPDNRFLAGCGFVGALPGDGTRAVGCFWSEALGWPLVWDQDQETAIRSPRGGPKITWGGPPLDPRVGPNRLRFELRVGGGLDHEAEVDRLVSLGARRADRVVDTSSTLLRDPDGNEFWLLAR